MYGFSWLKPGSDLNLPGVRSVGKQQESYTRESRAGRSARSRSASNGAAGNGISRPSQPACFHQLWKRFPCVPCRLVVAKKLSSTGSIDLSTVVPKSVDRTCRQIFCCLTSKQNCEGCHASSFLPTVVPKTANDLSAAFPPEISRTWFRRSTSSFMAHQRQCPPI